MIFELEKDDGVLTVKFRSGDMVVPVTFDCGLWLEKLAALRTGYMLMPPEMRQGQFYERSWKLFREAGVPECGAPGSVVEALDHAMNDEMVRIKKKLGISFPSAPSSAADSTPAAPANSAPLPPSPTASPATG